ncbi:TAXI family TRAP transporter solute-binding subunit [Cetobacterium sp.]|uniref:TAXI family TRAP transporter solute-binding subunit n=1 Tax=Cetobacterium sp. TaxID=2071632 RepID=UPI003F3668B5
MKKWLLMACLFGTITVYGSEKPAKRVHLTFATQEVGTGAYQYASAISNVFLKGLPKGSNIDLTTESPGGVGAPIVLENEQCDIIMSNAGPAKWSKEVGILGRETTKSIRAIAGGLGNDFVNILFTKEFVNKTGITSMEELIEKKYPVKIAIKKVGTLGNLSGVKLFEAYGLTFEDVKSWGGSVDLLGGDAIKIYLQDGKADMTIDHVAAGQANTTELCMTKEMFFPQLSDETLKKMVDNGFDYIDIPANTWSGQKEAIKSIGSQQVILVHESMNQDTAYRLAKSLVEGKDELSSQLAALSYFDPSKAGTPSQAGVQLHPGAEKYYKENGYLN